MSAEKRILRTKNVSVGPLLQMQQILATRLKRMMPHGEADLIEFMKTCIERADNEAQHLPTSRGQVNDLNEFFRKMLPG